MNDCITQQGCPNKACSKYGEISDVTLHDKNLNRLRCRTCGKTWSAHYREFHFGLRTNPVKVRRAVDMLRAGMPIRKIARLVDVNAGTVMRWKKNLTTNNVSVTSVALTTIFIAEIHPRINKKQLFQCVHDLN